MKKATTNHTEGTSTSLSAGTSTRESVNYAKGLRVAAYPDERLLRQLDRWAKDNKMDRNGALRHIMRVMLNVQDDLPDTALRLCISMLEKQVSRIRESSDY